MMNVRSVIGIDISSSSADRHSRTDQRDQMTIAIASAAS